MPRANRTYWPGHAWHITHRCHDRAFLLRAAIDRDCWRRWLCEATTRYGLCVLNFVVTSNHIHLLIFDTKGQESLSRSLQLVQGATAQAYNRRRGRRGAFWQDRHHAVAVDTDEHLWRCLTYIDLNMVRAGAVAHPMDWRHCGYNEIAQPRARYPIIDVEWLAALTGCASIDALQRWRRDQVDEALRRRQLDRNSIWTESIAVGRLAFVESMRARLGLSRLQRIQPAAESAYVLKEDSAGWLPGTHQRGHVEVRQNRPTLDF